jgi:Cysteine-rich secretory protein family
MRLAHVILLLMMTVFLVAAAGGCGDDDATSPSGIDDDDDDDTPSDLYSDACEIDYGLNMGCEASTPECEHAGLINVDRFYNPDESDCAAALTYDDPVAAVALAHAQDMCDRSFFAHENPDGQSPFDRMDEADVDWVAAGENIFKACGYDLDTVVSLAEEEFMDEPECEQNHRSNILARNFQQVGVGIVECDDGCIYLTQNFVTYDFSDIRDDPHDYCPDLN